MKTPTMALYSIRAVLAVMAVLFALAVGLHPVGARASGGNGGTKADTVKVSKCFYDAPTGQMLIKASSSDPAATLYAYLPSGALAGEVQNGGGSRYGGTVMGYFPTNPITICIRSTAGGSIVVPTTPFQP